MPAPKYKAAAAGFIIGTHYKKGAVVPLTQAQAKYLVAPYGDAVVVADEDDKPASKGK